MTMHKSNKSGPSAKAVRLPPANPVKLWVDTAYDAVLTSHRLEAHEQV